jgi:hypothetical protein
VGVLQSKSRNDLHTLAQVRKLKIEIADKVNEVLKQIAPPEHGEKAEGEGDKESEGHEEKKEPKPPAKRVHEDWDSDEGPVLKVYFQAFVIQ